MAVIALVGALDTKGAEYAFLADRVRAFGATAPRRLRGARRTAASGADRPRPDRGARGGSLTELRGRGDRNAAITVMARGAGTGLSAKCAEAAGLDFVVIYNSGRYRMAGRSSMAGLMPYGDANAIVMEMGTEVLPVTDRLPVMAGVCGTDPFRDIPRFLDQVKAAGFAGVQNYPTVCLFDGMIRANLEETGLGFYREVEMIAAARERDLVTLAYVHSEDEATAMTEAGADILVPHMGLTTSGMIGAQTALSLDDSVELVTRLRDAIFAVRPDALVVCHGGPIATPEDAGHILEKVAGIVGFLGASSMERLPTETAMVNHMRSFQTIRPSS